MRPLDWMGLGIGIVLLIQGQSGAFDKLYNGVIEGIALQDLDFFARMSYELSAPENLIGKLRSEEPFAFFIANFFAVSIFVEICMFPLKVLADTKRNLSFRQDDAEVPRAFEVSE